MAQPVPFYTYRFCINRQWYYWTKQVSLEEMKQIIFQQVESTLEISDHNSARWNIQPKEILLPDPEPVNADKLKIKHSDKDAMLDEYYQQRLTPRQIMTKHGIEGETSKFYNFLTTKRAIKYRQAHGIRKIRIS